ncbi:Phytanoyl-CoA dioxygenase (PhyH) [Hartmannibacter diazotrophicus]|uniref:Phytanoyl-CoA dioxygenase (PhyH) n=1 Tax=Hartmannibacter diazotrophicus TaxID=1482074 RepID=A0A2C9D2P2_9HYPH|nr:phytanoyl-CoA dioxygenase family protein [Hartmannibacter diazotrophicus]SON53745.1 Phytanoyl-CoA dioxygenase (PhyH) [Hartmannibacter diazotrophicus]
MANAETVIQDPTAILPSDDDIAAFQRDGAIVLRGVFSDWIAPLAAGMETLMAHPSPRERSYKPKDGGAPFFQDLCNWQDIPEFRDFVLGSPAGAIAAHLMGSKKGRFFHDHVLVKEPGNSMVTPWHQDMPYYCVGGAQSVSFWVPLDPVSRETTLECVAGTHVSGLDHRPERFDGTALYENDTRAPVPDVDGNRDAYTILGWALEPGDAVAFNFRTLHGAPANTSTRRRRVFSARWVGDDAVFIDRGGKGSPPFSHLTLKTGEPLEGPDFPVVYERA